MAKKSNGAISVMKQEDDWRAESDMRTLIEAECIKKDAKRHKKAQECAKQKMLEVAAVASESAES